VEERERPDGGGGGICIGAVRADDGIRSTRWRSVMARTACIAACALSCRVGMSSSGISSGSPGGEGSSTVGSTIIGVRTGAVEPAGAAAAARGGGEGADRGGCEAAASVAFAIAAFALAKSSLALMSCVDSYSSTSSSSSMVALICSKRSIISRAEPKRLSFTGSKARLNHGSSSRGAGVFVRGVKLPLQMA
jgi:hypothetical protein